MFSGKVILGYSISIQECSERMVCSGEDISSYNVCGTWTSANYMRVAVALLLV